MLAIIDQLLRTRSRFLETLEEEALVDLAPIARALILTIGASAGVFGATLGAYRGGLQVALAALKLPFVVLFTAGVATPALMALNEVLGTGAAPRRDLAHVLSALALACVLASALAPVVLLALMLDASYHQMILVVVGCCLVAGGAGVLVFLRGLSSTGGSRVAIAGVALALFALVGTQMAWLFRPYLVRPRSVEAPLVRALEGGFFDSVYRTSDSARGIYEPAPAPVKR